MSKAKPAPTYDERMVMEEFSLAFKRAMEIAQLTRRQVAERAKVAIEYVDDVLEGRIDDIELRSMVDLMFACGARFNIQLVAKRLP